METVGGQVATVFTSEVISADVVHGWAHSHTGRIVEIISRTTTQAASCVDGTGSAFVFAAGYACTVVDVEIVGALRYTIAVLHSQVGSAAGAVGRHHRARKALDGAVGAYPVCAIRNCDIKRTG